ncbi:dihydrofolate reductase family protein [Sphingomonas sp.]|uniref:dihydrofolate reductase family protein n=1 Tax=Sphingomonas sp. TaxID=28214 RepID=UPI001ECEEE59|nr:dihydrofolate reductase family protein [Sphingomonas sp.]MBX3594768.1 dihydrofolate reductase family protein [Sphingomonas sp.]
MERGNGKTRVSGFTVSIDGFGAGPHQDLAHPMGRGSAALHAWLKHTRVFHAMTGQAGGSDGVDQRFAQASMAGVGAWVMGRNMFGPVRGDWPDFAWQGWWGDEPPYRCPVFVLTHYPRPPLEMKGGTVFHFVTDGPDAALAQARVAAGGRDVRIGGGVATVRHYLTTGAIDALHLAISPVLLGAGEALLTGIDLPALGYRVGAAEPGEHAMHVTITRD